MQRLFEQYLDASYRRPLWPLLCACALTALAVLGATKIELRTDFRELLPRQARSITDLEHIERRVGGMGSLVLAIESPDKDANIRFIEVAAAALKKLPPTEVRWVDYHVRDERDFFEKNKLLYAELPDLRSLRDELRAKIEEERDKRFDLGLDTPAPGAAPKKRTFDVEAYKQKYQAKLAEFDRYPGGYYLGEDGQLGTITLRVPGSATGVDNAKRLIAKLQQLIADLQPTRYHPELKVGITGDMRTAIEEYEATRDDLFFVSTVCLGLVMLVIVLFFRSFRSLFVLGLPLLMGVAWTFGITGVTVGSLNASTMFLASIVAGNGVNFGIILLARYVEERRGGRASREALSIASRYTARATIVAALAAGMAYGSLLATDFRGFNQFGFIGGIGMVVCWLATFLVMPPLLAFAERLRPFARHAKPERKDSRFAAGFAALATRWPRAVVVLGLLSFGAAAWIGGLFLARDPFLYNFRYLRNQESRDTGATPLRHRVTPVAHSQYSAPAGMILLTENLEQVPRLELALWTRNHGKGPFEYPIGSVSTIFNMLPKQQKEKLPVLADIRELIVKNTLKWLTPAQKQEVLRITPPADLRELGLADLPDNMARPFTDVDGVRGLIVYANLAPYMSVWNGLDVIRFADAVREVKLGDGEAVHASGAPVIFADMIQAVLDDGPRAALFSFLGVLLLVILAFRRLSIMLLTVGVLLLGVTWLVGAMGGWDMLVRYLTADGYELSERFVGAIPKLNFLNFIVIPLTIGIGVDYGVNVAVRYTQEGEGSMRSVLASTGGAVVLCSLTTIIGYSALLLSRNLALVSFGKLANLGEVACLIASLTVLPAAVIWLEKRRKQRAARLATRLAARDSAPGE